MQSIQTVPAEWASIDVFFPEIFNGDADQWQATAIERVVNYVGTTPQINIIIRLIRQESCEPASFRYQWDDNAKRLYLVTGDVQQILTIQNVAISALSAVLQSRMGLY